MKVPVTGRAASLHSMPRRSTIVEIGVHQGDFSNRILSIARPKTLFLVDPWKHFDSEVFSNSHYGGEKMNQEKMDARHDGVAKRFSREIKAGTVEIKRALSHEAAETFEDESIDCVYIDGDHTYEGVKRDIDSYFPKLKSGGLMFGDDYLLGQWWGDGVCRAFHERLAEGGCILHFMMDDQVCLKKL